MAKSKLLKNPEEVIIQFKPPASPHACHFVCSYTTTHFYSLFFFTSIFFFTFSEASSRSVPPTPSPTSALKPTNHIDSSTVIIIAVSTAAFIALLLIGIMVSIHCFGFEFKLKRKQNRINNTNTVDGENPAGDLDSVDESGNFVRKFSWDEIERSTNNFAKVIGFGGYSNCYLGRNSNPNSKSGFWAIKINNGSERLNQVFKQELDILLHLRHDHIVKLLGYCDKQEEGALVFEYVANGNLQEKLHGGELATVLPWKNRMAIAYQIAQALEYLHEKCDLQIVHMDIKASNVLLDEDLNCKLCDFGSAKMGFSSTVQPPSSRPRSQHALTMMGSPGYTDPHYLRTGIASKKNDVYSFGVLILELVTGMEAFCSEKGQFLTSLVGSRLRDDGCAAATEVAEMVDPRLGTAGFDTEEAKVMLSISAACLRQSPALRPSASQIMQTIGDKISSISFMQSHHKSVYD